ncbi:MAG: gas vesicle protein K [Planctomycetota bacterium]
MNPSLCASESSSAPGQSTERAIADALAAAGAPAAQSSTAPRIDLDADTVGKGLAQLVLTVVRLLHELLERQAIRRIDAGSLSAGDIESLGETLRLQAEEIRATADRFGLDVEDLNLDLGPLGRVF